MKKKIFFYILLLPLSLIGQNINSKNNSIVFSILEQVIKHKKQNNPKSLSSFQYNIYNKFYVDNILYNYTNHDSLSNNLYAKNNKELIFLGEKVTDYKYDEKLGEKRNIIAYKTSGFKNPPYNLFNENIFKEEFPNILKKNISSYYFQIVDSIKYNNRKTYVINFHSKRNLLINGKRGTLYIDSLSYAVVKYFGEEYKTEYNLIFDYEWETFSSIWYLKSKVLKIKLNSLTPTDILGKNASKLHFILNPWIIFEEKVINFSNKTSFSPKDFMGYSFELNKDIKQKTDIRLKDIRPDSLSCKELNTYNSTYSLFDLLSLEKKIKFSEAFNKGELYLGKFSLDYPNTLRFNNYNGFRIQLGGKTNSSLSQNFSVFGYGAYLTQFSSFKAGGGITFYINKKYDGQLNINGGWDVNPFGRDVIKFNNYERIQEQLNYVQNRAFYKYKKGEISYKQDFFKKFTTSFIVNYSVQKSNFHYSYKNIPNSHKFNQIGSGINIHYAPWAEYMMTPNGKITLKNKPISFNFNYQKNWKILNGDFDYQSFNFSSDLNIKNSWGNSLISANLGYIKGETALWNLYGSFGNAKNGTSILTRFGNRGMKTFETIFPDHFYADRYASFFFTHVFNNLKIWEDKKIQIALSYNGMIGNMKNKEIHSIFQFNIPTKYYQEAGIDINNLIYFFGTGLYYRIGDYHTGKPEDNLFLKLTFNLPKNKIY